MVGARGRSAAPRFNRGDHVGALAEQVHAGEHLQVLYPSDDTPAGQELRLRQEYFFASASLQDLLRRHHAAARRPAPLPDQAAIQLNDTHPAIAVAELMRLLVDVHGVAWDEAWAITSGTHLLHQSHPVARGAGELAGALLERLLPRHMQIIYRINALHLDGCAQRADDGDPVVACR